jgi:hypothetical protein
MIAAAPSAGARETVPIARWGRTASAQFRRSTRVAAADAVRPQAAIFIPRGELRLMGQCLSDRNAPRSRVGHCSDGLLVWHELRARQEAVEMSSDDFLYYDIRMLLGDHVRVEVVLPEIDRTSEVLGQERHQP